ncbi:hypothetical protein RYX36_014946, partial [Vicia faba]
MATASSKRWISLEVKPDVMNQCLSGLVLLEDQARCDDVYGLNEELLEMVPKPVLAVFFLYLLTNKSKEERLQQNKKKNQKSE